MIAKLEPRIALPEGYRDSHVLPEYEQGAVDVLNSYHMWLNGEPTTTLELMRIDWAEEGFNRETDTVVVIAPDGRVVGYNNIYDHTSLHVRNFGWMAVDPELLDSAVADYLVEWGIERAMKNIDKAQEGTRVVLHMFTNAARGEICRLLEDHQMQMVRNFYRMVIDLDQPVPAPDLPAGIVIRPINGETDLREALRAVYDSFRDHWGFLEEPVDEFIERWERRIKTDPYYDPSLYFVAVDGEKTEGISLCYPFIEEDPEMSWVGTLGVRREWRKRGLALALLRHSFQEFQRRGKPRAGLGVDASSMTGAVRLYEKAGMRVGVKSALYEYELRPGKDLMRQTLE
jgi:GNAT superfamily N-acetyltransferase